MTTPNRRDVLEIGGNLAWKSSLNLLNKKEGIARKRVRFTCDFRKLISHPGGWDRADLSIASLNGNERQAESLLNYSTCFIPMRGVWDNDIPYRHYSPEGLVWQQNELAKSS